MYGDLVGVENSGSITGNLIERFTKSNITHVGMRINRELFLEAAIPEIKITSFQKLSNKNYWICELKDEYKKRIFRNKSKIDKFVSEQLDRPYDFIGLGLFIPYILSGGIYTPKENNKFYKCSELVAKIYELAYIIPDINTSIVTPSDLFNLGIYQNRQYIKNRGKK